MPKLISVELTAGQCELIAAYLKDIVQHMDENRIGDPHLRGLVEGARTRIQDAAMRN